jgi:hypothetical protein
MAYKRETLENMTVDELKDLCYDKDIKGVSKKPKAVIIDKIMEKFGAKERTSFAPAKTPAPMKGLSGEFESELTNPSGRTGDKTTTTVQVSCGASSGRFPVIGRTVREVSEFLKEILNVDTLSSGLVNGREVGSDYVLKARDTLEFIKPSGRKG